MRKLPERIFISILIAFLLSGCAYFKGSILPAVEARENLVLARELANKGDISKAEEVYKSIIRRYPGSSVGADASFELTLLYISPKNKKKDFGKAYEGFHTFLERYPDHKRAEVAGYLLEVLKKISSLESEMKELKDELIKLEMMGRELKR
jgi:outer membrane protein assembly factor BamD (BamD/ComL family)